MAACGTHVVYDITVYEDESYEAAGCFSHNSWRPNTLNWGKSTTKPIEAGFKRINVKLAEEKRIELTKAGWAPPLIEQACKDLIRLPVSVRSCAMAPAGQCLTDADLKTAEVVGLGFLSGDQNLIAAVRDEDKQFGIACKDEAILEKCSSMADRDEIRSFLDEVAGKSAKPARVLYDPAISRIPGTANLSELLTDPDSKYLIRDAQGQIVSPKRDIHWEMGESFMLQPREKLNKDAHRGAGKVGIFCLAAGELVETDRGPVKIQDVKLTDLLWDGEEWVRHEGVLCNGEQRAYYYDGLWATNNHLVWTAQGEKVRFGSAREQGIRLKRVERPSLPADIGGLHPLSGNHQGQVEGKLRDNDRVPNLQGEKGKVHKQIGAREVSLLLPSELPREPHTTDEIPRNGAALYEGFSQGLPSLQGERHTGGVSVLPGVCGLGSGEVAKHGLQGNGVRSDRQQRALLQGESAAGNALREYVQLQDDTAGKYTNGEGVLGEAPGGLIYRERGAEVSSEDVRGGTVRTPQQESARSGASKVCKVYDILNVGPRHRFVCSGVLVSNSIPYDASPKLIEMQVHGITGKKPEDGLGQKVIDAYHNSFPVATQYLQDRADAVDREGFFRSVSGRIRHFCIKRLEDVEGLSDWQRKSILSPLTREARNYPLQEIVAATMARANIMLLEKLIQQGMDSRIMILLYDAITMLGPLEERHEVRKLLKWAMSTNNVWDIEGRKLQFEIDCDFTIRWATDPTDEEKKLFT